MKVKSIVKYVVVSGFAASMLAGCGQKYADPASSPSPTKQTVNGSLPSPSPSVSPAKSWTKPPDMKIDPAKSYSAEFDTNKGKFTIELFAKDAPKTVNNFVFLANEHFYNGVIFHRILQSFMVQTGDPLGTGRGGPGYKFEDEKTSYKYETGTVAMANSGQNTNGSQFFICTGKDCENLNKKPNYTIFGKVADGMDVVQKIAATPVKVDPQSGEPSQPTEKVTINAIKISEK